MRKSTPRLIVARSSIGFDLAFHFRNGALEHFRVEIETYGVDVAVLLAAQQIPRAAQFEIKRGNAESGAEVAEFLERREPAPRDRA